MAVSKKLIILIYMTAALIVSFLFGFHFGESQVSPSDSQETPLIYIEQLKTKLKITKNDPQVEIFLNGEKLDGDISLTIWHDS